MNIPLEAVMIENTMKIRKEDYRQFVRALRRILKRHDWNDEMTDEEVHELCGFNIALHSTEPTLWLDWYPRYITSDVAPEDDEILIAIAPYVIDGCKVTFRDSEEESYFGVFYLGGQAYKLTGHIAWEEDDEPLSLN